MKKTEWPIRWDLLLRYRLIEIISLWEGRLTTNHICHGFGIGRQQASKDINTYLRELAPENLEYDRHLKGYVPTSQFKPVVTRGHGSEYLDLIARNQTLSDTFESLNIDLPHNLVLQGTPHRASPDVVRTLATAARQGRRVEAGYVSMNQPEPEQYTLEPHTLVFSGQSWHVRAWCEQSRSFGDFLLSRFRGTPRLPGSRNRHTVHQDENWQRQVTIELRPDPRLTPWQQAIIATDYGMDNVHEQPRLRLTSRAALVPYTLALAGLRSASPDPDPVVQQIELANQEALTPWLNQSAPVREELAESC